MPTSDKKVCPKSTNKDTDTDRVNITIYGLWVTIITLRIVYSTEHVYIRRKYKT